MGNIYPSLKSRKKCLHIFWPCAKLLSNIIVLKAMKEKSTQGGSTREAVPLTGSTAGKKPAEVLSGVAS